jgi:hypothetical protein
MPLNSDPRAVARRGRPLFRPAAFAPLVLLLALCAATLSTKEEPSKDARINLIRGFVSEIAVSKVVLPRGKRGIFLDAQGKIDQSDADKELRMNGAAVNSGTPVAITKITFKPHRVVFEINGGGKRRKKWYQRIEIGVGSQTVPIAPQTQILAYGSWITLKLPEKDEDLTVDQTKELLNGVLDFTRHSPTVLYSPVVPAEFKEAIKNHKVLVGMDRDAVLSSKGAPERKVREQRPDGTEEEDWIYGLPPHVLYVVLEGDTVVRVQQY